MLGMKKNLLVYLVLLFWMQWTTSCNGDFPLADRTRSYIAFSSESPMRFMIYERGHVPAQFEYSLNGGDWKAYTLNEVLDFGSTHGTLRLRGSNAFGTAVSSANKLRVIVDGPEEALFEVSGDIRTLVDWKNYESADMTQARFSGLFQYCRLMVSAPDLPAMQLDEECYEFMFDGCFNLLKAPELPATQLEESCYRSMFRDCVSLQETPTLPATEVPKYCYSTMFDGCKGLKKAGSIEAVKLGEYACESMFYGCDSLLAAPELHATQLAKSCCVSMFRRCKSLVTAPDVLPAKNLALNCYAGMFAECVNLAKTPVLPAEVLENGCYSSMFEDCHALREVTMLAHHIEETNVEEWLGGTPGGIFRKSPHMSLEALYHANAVCEGGEWQVVDYE